MADSETFSEFLRRIRAGDADAAAELVRQYESVVRVEVRMRLSDARLRRIFDSQDICQSALRSFFIGAAGGQYELHQPEDLVRLLVGIARNKLAFQARKHRRQCRDVRRQEALTEGTPEATAADATPSVQIETVELIQEFRKRLTALERDMAERRCLGQEWNQIASDLGGTSQARRKQFERAIERVSRQLGLEDALDD